MKTIARQLNVKDFPFEINDKNGNQVYFENANGYWEKREFDENGNQVYFEDFVGYWEKREYDQGSNQVRYENSKGTVIDDRPKVELSMDEIAAKFGIDVNKLKIKKG